MIIDESTRMDSTAFIGKKNTFCYFYTLIGMEEDSTSIATLKAEMAERIPKYLKKTVEMKPYKEAKVTLQYTYFSDNTKEKLFQLEIPADKY